VLGHRLRSAARAGDGALTLAIGSAPLGTLEIGALTVLLGTPLAVALMRGVHATGGPGSPALPRFRAS